MEIINEEKNIKCSNCKTNLNYTPKDIKTSYRRRLEQLEKNWNELGKNSPDYHKI